MEVLYNYTFVLVAQVTKDGIELGGLFDGLKINADSYSKLIDSFKQIKSFDEYFDIESGKYKWDEIAKAIGTTDERAISYFKTLNDGKGKIDNSSASIEGMSAYLKKSGQAFDFAAVKAKLLNAALNASIMLAFSIAIKAVTDALDKANVTVAEQQEKVDSLVSSISELKSEYDELSSKQDLTDAENRRLEYLERRLELDERILQAKKQQLFNEKTGNKFTDYFDSDNLNTQYAEEMDIEHNKDRYGYLSAFYSAKNVQEIIKQYKELQATAIGNSNNWNALQSNNCPLSKNCMNTRL